ncbi:AraC family transcriptional regulator [Tumebacillus sp. ITR2]|uniref:AraC family transcriptional regulator n=1 Tax=Tumebacillus amylolyticus TaxID=2801339 RepID=A0ABS1J4C8_9BACL|nr:GyrI-like domain-containing protein [Tumebacillus amylolyticus]MBL0385128.1 AraC family transcriptional regulator [Tumebacillus amylolyticus]
MVEPVVVKVPDFQVVGFSFSTNLKEFVDHQLGQKAYQELLSRAGEMPDKVGNEVYLIQVYPTKPGFNAMVDVFTQIIGYKVSNEARVPSGMMKHEVPANEYAKYTHKGLESELVGTYDYLYGKWLPQSGRQFAGYDFEIWDDRYKPESPENEIDVHVAVK